MRALCWHGKEDIRCETVPDPTIQDARDIVIKVTACAICGSDLHLMGGFVPEMKSGDVMGHETMGEVVETGNAITSLKVGDRVVVPFTISCGECRQCQWGNFSCCERSNPAGAKQAKQVGYPTAGLFGYSHMYGGFPGGQAQFVRVPYSDVGPIKVPDGLTDEQVLFLSDIFPTGWMAAENCAIGGGGTGAGGEAAEIRSAFLQGAPRVIAIDPPPSGGERAAKAGAEAINYHQVKV